MKLIVGKGGATNSSDQHDYKKTSFHKAISYTPTLLPSRENEIVGSHGGDEERRRKQGYNRTIMRIRVILAGATGWAGSALSKGILQSGDIQLIGGVSAQHFGKNLCDVLNVSGPAVPLHATVKEALSASCDVFVEYTNAKLAKHNVLTAISHNAHVVIGTSGISDEEYREIHEAAVAKNVGVLAVGNFSMPALVLHKCAELAARHLKSWEIIDYASENKMDAPSGTVRELTNRLSRAGKPRIRIPLETTEGLKEARGATLNNMQVHSVRLPGYTISAEIIFGDHDQKLSIRYDAGTDPDAYVPGALLAIRNVSHFKGLKRGLDSIIDL
jgi:4-hydroxy-tetrahydrodipicolinate reductase